jgi:hypothetical protein
MTDSEAMDIRARLKAAVKWRNVNVPPIDAGIIKTAYNANPLTSKEVFLNRLIGEFNKPERQTQIDSAVGPVGRDEKKLNILLEDIVKSVLTGSRLASKTEKAIRQRMKSIAEHGILSAADAKEAGIQIAESADQRPYIGRVGNDRISGVEIWKSGNIDESEVDDAVYKKNAYSMLSVIPENEWSEGRLGEAEERLKNTIIAVQYFQNPSTLAEEEGYSRVRGPDFRDGQFGEYDQPEIRTSILFLSTSSLLPKKNLKAKKIKLFLCLAIKIWSSVGSVCVHQIFSLLLSNTFQRAIMECIGCMLCACLSMKICQMFMLLRLLYRRAGGWRNRIRRI